MTDYTPLTDPDSKSPKATQDNVNQDATATATQNRANQDESLQEGNYADNAATLGNPNQAQNTAPNQSRTPEHAQGFNAEPANDPNAVAAAAATAAAANDPSFDQTTNSQVAARVAGGHTGLAQGVGIAVGTVGNLPAGTLIELVKGVKGSLDLVSSELVGLVEGVDGIGDAELSRVQVAIDAAQKNVDGIFHLARTANEQAHTPASQS